MLHFYDELDIKQLSEDRLMEDVFEDALKNGEFQLWYQPKVDPVTGNILGAEALIRWKRPDGTMLSPGKFIPLFEKNGNITTLDEYVFRTTAEMAAGRSNIVSDFCKYFQSQPILQQCGR